MARVALTVANTSRVSPRIVTPVVHTEAAANATDFNSFANTGRELLIVRNSGASTRTIKFYDKNDRQVGETRDLAAGKSYVFGPFPVDEYGTTVEVDISHAEILCIVAEVNYSGIFSQPGH